MRRFQLVGLCLVASLGSCKKTARNADKEALKTKATDPSRAPAQPKQKDVVIPPSPKTPTHWKHMFSQSYGGEENEHVRAMTKSKSGSIVLGGFYEESNPFLKKQDNPHKRNAFVTSLTNAGEVAWSVSIGGKQTDTVDALTTDSNENVLFSGLFSHALSFGEDSLRSEGADDIYLASYSPQGQRKWVKTFGGPDVDVPYDIAVDKEDNVILTGEFRLSAKFLGESVQTRGESDIFLCKFSSNGELLWLKTFGSTGEDAGRAVTLDGQGNIVLASTFSRSIDFGLGPMESNGNHDVALVKLNSQGQTIWNTSYGTNLNDLIYDVATGPANQIVVAGAFEDKLDLGTIALESKGKFDALLAQFTANGDIGWAKSLGAKENDYVARVGVTKDHRVIATGGFWYEVNWGKQALKSEGDKDIFLLEAASDGTPLYANRFGAEQKDSVKGLSVDEQITLAGTFHYDINFGGDDLVQGEKEKGKLPKGDVFVATFE